MLSNTFKIGKQIIIFFVFLGTLPLRLLYIPYPNPLIRKIQKNHIRSKVLYNLRIYPGFADFPFLKAGDIQFFNR